MAYEKHKDPMSWATFRTPVSPTESERSPVESIASISSRFSTANDQITAIRIRQITSLLNQCLIQTDGEPKVDPLDELEASQGIQGERPGDLRKDLDRLEEVAISLASAAQLGDYAGHVWNCLRRASGGSLTGSVVSVSGKLRRKDKAETECILLDSLRVAIEELAQDHIQIDEDTAIEAIHLYADRNLTVHTDHETYFALHKDEQGLDKLLRGVQSDPATRERWKRIVQLWTLVKRWMRQNQDVELAPEQHREP